MTSIADNIRNVTQRIQKATQAAGRSPDEVTLLAVSKTRTPDELRQAVAAGLTRFGENYLREALDKMTALADLPGLEWHFIGPIQSNKTRTIAEHFSWVHSVDRVKIARRLSDQRPAESDPLNLCIQVNLDQEETKSGVLLELVDELAETVVDLPRVRLRGLMAIPAPRQPVTQLHQRFHSLADKLQQLRQRYAGYPGLDTLSMGMSDDLEIAIAEGSTLVRIGTALFGPRETHKNPIH